MLTEVEPTSLMLHEGRTHWQRVGRLGQLHCLASACIRERTWCSGAGWFLGSRWVYQRTATSENFASVAAKQSLSTARISQCLQQWDISHQSNLSARSDVCVDGVHMCHMCAPTVGNRSFNGSRSCDVFRHGSLASSLGIFPQALVLNLRTSPTASLRFPRFLPQDGVKFLPGWRICETSQDQSPGTPGAAGDFGWKVLTSERPC